MNAWLRFATYAMLAAFNGIILLLLHQEWPRVGFDHSYFQPRLLDVHLHYLADGISIQWWTPSFGGGLPAFPNPQHTQLMLPQLLLPLTDPWTATVLGILLPSSFCHLLIVKFTLDHLAWSPIASLVAAAVFSTNNFFLYHAFSGHLGFATFPLVAVLPFCFQGAAPAGRALALFALTGTVIIFTGGYTVIIVYLLTALLLAIGLSLADATAFPCRRSLCVIAGGGVLMLTACAAKLCAVALFMQQFPRIVDYAHPAKTTLEACVSVPAQLLLWKPLLFLERVGWLSADDVFARWAGVGVEDLGLSPVALVLLPLGVAVWIKRWRASGTIPLALALIGVVWLTVEFTLGRGVFWPWLKPLPILRSLHANSRFGSAFILPAALLCGLGVHAFLARPRPRGAPAAVLLAAVGLSLISLLPLRRLMHGHWFGGFDLSPIQAAWTQIEAGNRFVPITAIADVRDDQVFALQASSWKPYEPIFGYGYAGADFRTRLKVGPIPSSAGSPFNLNHPVALYAPAHVDVSPFTPLPGSENENAWQFLRRQQPTGWRLPQIQLAANALSLVGLFAITFGLFRGIRPYGRITPSAISPS